MLSDALERGSIPPSLTRGTGYACALQDCGIQGPPPFLSVRHKLFLMRSRMSLIVRDLEMAWGTVSRRWQMMAQMSICGWWLETCFVNELSVNSDAVTISSVFCPSRGGRYL